MSSKTRAVSAKGVQEFKPYITKAIPTGTSLVCADNTGAKILEIIICKIKRKYSIKI